MKNKINWNLKHCVFAVLSVLVLTGFMGCRRQTIEHPSPNEKIPVSITTDFNKPITRMDGTNYETDDQVGLFLLEQPNKIAETRYVNNHCFSYDGTSWEAGSPIYYPTKTGLCDLYLYYPYQQTALPAGSSVLRFVVQPDQRTAQNCMKSDLLVAKLESVTPSVTPVAFVSKHKLVEINVRLLPGDGYDSAQEMLESNPVVTLMGVFTGISYDMESDECSAPTDKDNVKFLSEPVEKEGAVVGYRAIIVPQTVAAGHKVMNVKAGGKSFNFYFENDFVMNAGTQLTLTLEITPANSGIEGTISVSVGEWENKEEHSGKLEEDTDPDEEQEEEEPLEGETPAEGYVINIPDFSQSLVYVAMDGEVRIAEICREYLLGAGVNNQAIVVYPIVEEVTDLSKGFVAQILDADGGNPLAEQVHGGSVRWYSATNSVSFQEGSSAPVSSIYISTEGVITTTAIQNATTATVTPDLINDDRDTPYPIVKIGTQYWMARNLKVTTLRDGTAIQADVSNAWKNGLEETKITKLLYCKNQAGDEYLYSLPVAQSQDIAPVAWKVPATADWELLKEYVDGDAAALKQSSWEEGTNLSGFSAGAYGYRSASVYSNNVASFWTSNGVSFEIYGTSLAIQSGSKYGFSIRCVRE